MELEAVQVQDICDGVVEKTRIDDDWKGTEQLKKLMTNYILEVQVLSLVR